jgi:hypothetical protein
MKWWSNRLLGSEGGKAKALKSQQNRDQLILPGVADHFISLRGVLKDHMPR